LAAAVAVADVSLSTLQISVGEKGLDVGAGVTLSTLEEVLKQQVASQPAHKTRGFAAAAEQLRWFAGTADVVAQLGKQLLSGFGPLLVTFGMCSVSM
jgi:hypothetical protein